MDYTVCPRVQIGKNVIIAPYTVIGKLPVVPTGTTTRKPLAIYKHTRIGDNCVIGAGVVIYTGCSIGNNTLIGDGAKLRDNSVVGDHCIIGMNTKIGYNTRIGDKVKIMDLCNIAGNMIIEDNVFIAQGVMCANDKYMGLKTTDSGQEFADAGPYIEAHARIGENATLLPGITIGHHAIIGAGSTVTDDIPPYSVVIGDKAKIRRYIDE